PTETPALFELVKESDLSSLSVRTDGEITCPADGWLTLATGRRTLAAERGTDPVCGHPAAVDLTGPRPLVDIEQLAEINRQLGWRPRLGAFGAAVQESGLHATAVGLGAALTLFDEEGTTPRFFPALPDFLEAGASGAAGWSGDLLVVDAGNISEPGFAYGTGTDGRATPSISDQPSRADQAAAIDTQVRALLEALSADGESPRVLLFGPGGTSTTAHLTVLAKRTADSGAAWLRTESTRREGVLHLTDLNPTLRKALGLSAAIDAVGAPAAASGERGDTAAAAAQLAGDDAAAHVIRDSLAPLMVTLGILNLLGLTAAVLIGRLGRGAASRQMGALSWQFLAALAVAPLATFIGAGLPWRDFAGLGLGAGLILAIAVSWVALSAVVLGGPWRRHPLGPVAAAGLITAVVLLVDSATGSALQWMSPLGDTALVAGRFYGISNPPFTLAYTGALIGLAIISEPIRRRFAPRAATGTMVAVGAVFTILVASPAAGANVGGTIAAVPGFIVLALLVSRVKVTRAGLGFMIFGGVFVFAVSALIDFAQPPENRAHLGRFIARVGQGELFPMLWRKVEASFTIVSGNLVITLISLLITGMLATMIVFPARWHVGALQGLYEEFPLLRAGVISTLIGISIAVFTNDSGVALAFITLMILAPMLAAAATRQWFAAHADHAVSAARAEHGG
ncbi:MAG TPA: hypothetical protein VK030_01170, partial [Actinomycetales bacterium]|nr:hypothetical protein [Actinomycetales bacterium]